MQMFTVQLRKSLARNFATPYIHAFKFCASQNVRQESRIHTSSTISWPCPSPEIHPCECSHAGIIHSTFKHRILKTQIKNLYSERNVSSDDEYFYNKDVKEPPKLFVVQPRCRPDYVLEAKLQEAIKLADSLEEQRPEETITTKSKTNDYNRKPTQHLVVQNPGLRTTKSHADTFFGPGTVDTVKSHIVAIDAEDGLDAVFVNAILTGIQQRNLEKAWEKPVLDRMGLIIEIFNAHANTKEAKLQAELAALMYKKTRLVRVRGPDGRLTFGAFGEAEVVSGRGRGTGGRGFISGAGETELQLQRRRILERRNQLLLEIAEIRRTRALQRAARKRHCKGYGRGMPVVAVVGYTNAGKSSLVGALSQSNLYIDDKLFATLDPRVRSIFLPSGQKVLLSDTVGFISDLPVQLVEAFHATLEEVTEADLLMHVIDVSAPNSEEQRESVLDVLQQIGVSSEKIKNMIEVWNKEDLLEGDAESTVPIQYIGHENSEPCTKEVPQGGSENLLYDKDAGSESSDGGIVGMAEVGDAEISTISSAKIKANLSPKGYSFVTTSATTGSGLQELLRLLDEKLKPACDTINLEDKYFVKWRPSFSEVTFHKAE